MSQLNLFPLANSIREGETKICRYCKIEKHVTSFPKHIAHKDNLDTRCRSCIKDQAAIRNEILKTAPDKPDSCECCGYPPKDNRFVLDHCHDTAVFRGWLCDKCNLSIGHLGDNIAGLEKAITYLRKHDERS